MHKSRQFRRISNKNVRELTGLSASAVTRLLNQVRAMFNKISRAPVFLTEFCAFTKFDIDEVCAFFNWD
jgi:hypothetical protein